MVLSAWFHPLQLQLQLFVVLLLLSTVSTLSPPYPHLVDPSGWSDELFAQEVVSSNDVDVIPAANSQYAWSAGLTHSAFNRVINGQLVHGHVFQVENPVGHFHVNQPLNNCPGMIRAAVSAQKAHCAGAMNAGFFNIYTGQCLGNLVSQGAVIQAPGGKNAMFGLTKTGQFVAGYLSLSNITDNSFEELVTGIGFLVRNGANWVEKAIVEEEVDFNFVYEKAPRVAVGVKSDGTLLMVEVDGDEAVMAGVDLFEMADLMVAYGAQMAVNLDGGGSATVYYGGKVVNNFSDWCPAAFGRRCERSVTSYLCIA